MHPRESTLSAAVGDTGLRAHVERIEQTLERVCFLNRALANDDFDRALEEIGGSLPGFEVQGFPSGSSVFDWRVPERWELRSATVRDPAGRVVIDAAAQPLHVVSYSLPKSGRVPRAELLEHLHSDPARPDVVPYRYAFYERDWGLCCSERQKQSLDQEWYEVEIDAADVPGDLHVGELVLPGERSETILFVGHVDHAMQANDGVLGALVLAELARLLAGRRSLTWTYRFLFVPERIGTIAWLSRSQELLPRILGGVVCEMPGVRGQSLSLQLSKWGDTKIDRVLQALLREIDPAAPVLPCWKHVVNDDGFLNAPGVDLPVASVSRSAPEGPFSHFPEYHSDRDTPERVDWKGVEETLSVLVRFCDVLERDRVPVPTYVGEPFLSKHGLWVDWRLDPGLNAALEEICHGIDGRQSLFDISAAVGLPFGQVAAFVEQMAAAGLVEWSPADRFYASTNSWDARAARRLPEGARQAGA